MARFFASWWRSLKHQRTKEAARPARYQLWAELLEDRALPSTVTWTNPVGGDWDTPANWSGGAVPGPGDDVVIDLAGQNNFTVTHSANVADSVQSLTSQDALVLSGGSLSLAAGSTINNTLTISGSTLITSAGLAVTGQFTASSSTLGGSGTVYLNGGTPANPNVIGDTTLTLDCTLVNNAFTQVAADISVASGVTITNAAGATLENLSAMPQSGASGEQCINYGTFVTQGNCMIAVPFTNGPTGLVHVEANTLTFTAGGVSSGQFVGDTGTGLAFESNFSFAAETAATPNSAINAPNVTFGFSGIQVVACPYTVSGGTYLAAYNGPLTVQFTGPVSVENSDLGTFVNGSGTFDFTAAQLEEPLTFDNVYGQASIISNADVHITGTFVMPNGFATFAGSGTIYLDGGTVANPNVIGNTLTLDCALVNNGYTQLAGGINLASGVNIINAVGATLESQDDSGIGAQSGAMGEGFINNGTLLRTTTGYYAQNNVIAVPFTNGPTGLVHVEANTLTFTAGGVSSGQFVGDTGTGLAFESNFSFAAETAATPNSAINAPNVTFGFSGIQVVACPYTVSGGTYLAAYNGPLTVQFTGPVSVENSDLGTFVNGSGTFDFTAAQLEEPLTFDNVYGQASIISNADVHITGTFVMPNGFATFAGSGTIYLDGGTVANPNVIGNTLTLDCALVNNGYTQLAGGINLASGVNIINAVGATLESQDDSGIGAQSGAMGEGFINNGTLLRTTTGYYAQNNVIAVPFTNGPTGLVHVEANTLTFTAGGLSSGQFAGDPGTVLSLASGVFTLNPASSITADNLVFGGGSVLGLGISGPIPGTGLDQISVNTAASLAGQLQIDMVNGYMPALGTVLTLVEPLGNATVQGTFADGPTLGAPGVAANGWRYATIFGLQYHNDVELTSLGSLTVTPNQSAVASSGIQPANNTGTYTSPAGTVTLSASLGTVINNGNGTWSWSYTPNNGPAQTQTVTITATDPDGNVATTTFKLTLNPATASQLVFTAPPASGLAGFDLNSPGGIQVSVETAAGAVVTSNSSTIAIAIISGPSGGAFISGSVTSAAIQSGVASFTQLALNQSGTYTLKATDGSLTAATATVVIQPSAGILLLDPTGQSLNLSGNAILNVSNYGAIYVNSTNTAAGTLSGNASLTATEVDLKGGLTTSGNAAVHGLVSKGVSVSADPLASLSAPTQPTTQFSAGSYSGTLKPGTYIGGITISGNNSATLQAGIYYLKGGGLTVSGNATVTGNGVMLYFTSVSGSGASSVNISGNATVTLTPPTSGTYQGIVLFQDRASTAAINISGNAALNTTGTEYAPGAKVNLSGNETNSNPAQTSLGSQWIVADLALSGNAKITITADANNRTANPNAFMVAGGPVNVGGPVASLTMAQADAAVTTALGMWKSAGLDAGTLAALKQTKVTIAPLPAPYLGLAAPGVIYLDPNADGYGWFTDDAMSAAVPAGKIDLITVVTHELGHLFGLMDGNGTPLMASTLAAGVRILPNAGDLLAPHTTLVAASAPTSVSETTFQQLGLNRPQQAAVAIETETVASKHAAQTAALETAADIDLDWLALPTTEPVGTCVVSTVSRDVQRAIDEIFETWVQSPSCNTYAEVLTLEAGVADRLTLGRTDKNVLDTVWTVEDSMAD